MITSTMSNLQKWEQLKRERCESIPQLLKMAKSVSHYIQKDQQKVLQKEGYPYFFTRKFISRAGNKKFIVMKIPDKRALKDLMSGKDFFARVYTMLDAGTKGVYIYRDVQRPHEHFEIYTAHYWARYRLRMNLGDDLSFYDLLVRHYKNNSSFCLQDNDLPNLKVYKDEIFVTSEEGVSLGRKPAENILQLNTFLSPDELKGEQLEAYRRNLLSLQLAVREAKMPKFRPVAITEANQHPQKKSLIEAAKKNRMARKNSLQMEKETVEKDWKDKKKERESFCSKMKHILREIITLKLYSYN